jgi:hypothetical protein
MSRPRPTEILPEPAKTTPERPVHQAKVAEFVCEDDVRQAIKQGRKIVIGERSIVTPAARDLGEEQRVFVEASWPQS